MLLTPIIQNSDSLFYSSSNKNVLKKKNKIERTRVHISCGMVRGPFSYQLSLNFFFKTTINRVNLFMNLEFCVRLKQTINILQLRIWTCKYVEQIIRSEPVMQEVFGQLNNMKL